VVYLVILVLLAGAGIARLWRVKRQHSTTLADVDGFRMSLERLSGQEGAPPQRSVSQPPPLGSEVEDSSLDPYLQPLDTERRAAAKARLEARRRNSVRNGDLRSR
jgi:hypothetical protein